MSENKNDRIKKYEARQKQLKELESQKSEVKKVEEKKKIIGWNINLNEPIF